MNAILVPGRPDKDEHYDPKWPSNSDNHWFPWLMRQLILQDIHAVSIELPFPFRPRYDAWKKEFERFDITPETILVGHSCGGGFLIRYLSEHPELKVGRVALVAPWINPFDKPTAETADFFKFTIDPNFPSRATSVTVLYSTDDSADVNKTVEILKEQTTGIDFREYADKGHFVIGSMGTQQFPELLAIVTGK